jgi:hypothetical protein
MEGIRNGEDMISLYGNDSKSASALYNVYGVDGSCLRCFLARGLGL